MRGAEDQGFRLCRRFTGNFAGDIRSRLAADVALINAGGFCGYNTTTICTIRKIQEN
jgi:hypothetical protein